MARSTYNPGATRAANAAKAQALKSGNGTKGDLGSASQAMTQWITDEDPSKNLVQTVKTLALNQGYRLYDNTRFLSIYSNCDFMQPYYGGGGFAGGVQGSNPERNYVRMADNRIKLCTDTLAGKLVQGNSAIKFLTSMGDWGLWNKAEKLERALTGEFSRMRLYREAQKVCTSGLVTGTGWLKLMLSEDGKRIDCEHVFGNEVFVDEQEAAYSKPRKMFQMRYCVKDTLRNLFPDKQAIIDKAQTAMPPRFAWTLYSPGMVEVMEGWALPVGPRKGRHVIAISSGVLLDEEWNEDWFPLIPFKPSDRPFGWYGQGFVEQTMGAQIILNKILNIMQKGAHLGTAPFWVVAEGANINIKHLDNMPGHIVETSGAEPKWMTNAPFHEAAPKYCEMLRKIISDFYGTNAMDTGGQPPINRIDSKKALREYEDMGNARITTLIERWQDFFVDVAERTIMLAGRIAKSQGGYPVLSKNKSQVNAAVKLDWADLQVARDEYLLRPAPVDFLSKTPSARLQDIQELLQTNLISQKAGQKMLQGPADIDAALSEAVATEDDIDNLIEGFVERKEYRAPISIQDLKTGLKRVADSYLQHRMWKLPEDRLGLFIRWLAEAQDLLQTLAPPPPPGPPQAPTPQPGGGQDAATPAAGGQ